MAYIDNIKEKARKDKKTIVLPESNDKRTLIAASHILEEGIADIIPSAESTPSTTKPSKLALQRRAKKEGYVKNV